MTPTRRLPATLTWLCLALATPQVLMAESEPANATRWLAQSEASAARLQTTGVYASYALTRVRLAQARAYAMLGDVENTRSHLPYADGAQPEWSSGGDGMVRMLLVSLDLDEIHASLLAVLADAGRTDDAYAYVAGLDPTQSIDPAYLQLGTALAMAGQTKARTPAGLTAMQSALRDAGIAQSLLQAGRPDAARDVIDAIEPETDRVQAVTILARRLVAGQDFDPVARLVELDVLPARETAELAQYAMSFALLSGDLNTATRLTAQVEEPAARDRLDATLAFALAEDGQQARAAEIFDAAKLYQAPTWEQAAIRLHRDAWLEAHYLAIKSPWRRSERLYQYARRKLDDGEKGEANRLAGLAAESAEEIPDGSTRWLAYELLAGYYARAGDPNAAATWAGKIPTEPQDARRLQIQAAAAVVEAWARAGDVKRALAEAGRIEDPLGRVSGLTAAAAATFKRNLDAYRRLVTAAEHSLRSAGEASRRQRQDGWADLVTMQCRAADLDGAMETAARAMTAGEGAAAYEAIVTFTLEAGDLSAAEQAARALPAGIDPDTGRDARAHAFVQVTESLAENGEGLKAATLLGEIDQKHAREMATPAVVEALIARGEQARAIELAVVLKRDDARERAVGVVLAALAAQGVLPDPAKLMSKVPARYGGELCWASAAATGADPQSLDRWLDALQQPECRAFAYAGAVYGQLAPPADRKPADLFARLDPSQAEARMAEAMQKSAAGQRMR